MASKPVTLTLSVIHSMDRIRVNVMVMSRLA